MRSIHAIKISFTDALKVKIKYWTAQDVNSLSVDFVKIYLCLYTVLGTCASPKKQTADLFFGKASLSDNVLQLNCVKVQWKGQLRCERRS
jgi:hypothetical protein